MSDVRKSIELHLNTLVPMVVFMGLPLGLVHSFSGFFELIVLNSGGQMRERAPTSSSETHLGLPV